MIVNHGWCSPRQSNHAQHVSDEITARGIVNHVVTSESPQEEESLPSNSSRRGTLRCIVNVNILTEGFNAPQTDMVVLLMATKSPSKFVQAVGRGMRICEGQEGLSNIGFWRETPNGWALLTISNHRKRRGPGKMGRGSSSKRVPKMSYHPSYLRSHVPGMRA